MGLSEYVVYPVVPNGFADHYPYEKWLFHWEYTQHFQTYPYDLKFYENISALQLLQLLAKAWLPSGTQLSGKLFWEALKTASVLNGIYGKWAIEQWPSGYGKSPCRLIFKR